MSVGSDSRPCWECTFLIKVIDAGYRVQSCIFHYDKSYCKENFWLNYVFCCNKTYNIFGLFFNNLIFYWESIEQKLVYILNRLSEQFLILIVR